MCLHWNASYTPHLIIYYNKILAFSTIFSLSAQKRSAFPASFTDFGSQIFPHARNLSAKRYGEAFLLNLDQFFRGRCEILISVFRHSCQILDPHTAHARKINARFHSHGHARLQDFIACRGKSGLLMNKQAHAVPQSVARCV